MQVISSAGEKWALSFMQLFPSYFTDLQGLCFSLGPAPALWELRVP